MIRVTRINQDHIVINAALIECVEATPDTVISMVHGKKIIVCESVEEIIERTIAYYQQIGCRFTLPLPHVHPGDVE